MEHTITGKRFSIGEMLEFSWKFFTKNWKDVLILLLAVYVPYIIAYSWMISYVDSMAKEVVLGNGPEYGLGIIIGGIVAYLVLIVLMTLMSMAATIYIADRIAGKMTTWQDSYGRALKRLPIAVGTMLLMFVLLILLSFLLVIPAIIFGLYWTFAIYVVTLKDKAWMEALRDSKKIVKGRWWTVLGYTIVFGIIAGLASMVVTFAVSAPFYFINNLFISSMVTQLASVPVLAYFMVLSVVFYLNFDANRVKMVEESAAPAMSEEA